MLDGIKNTVILPRFVNNRTEGCLVDNITYYRSGYVPTKEEFYFKYRADGNSVITLLSGPYLRFKILDTTEMMTLFDTNDSDNTSCYRTQFTGGWTNVEKASLNLVSGQNYYIVVYVPESMQATHSRFELSVGEGRFNEATETYFSANSITATPTSYSTNALIVIDDVPNTAVVTDLWLKSYTPGIHGSDIKHWRTKRQDQYSWLNNIEMNQLIQVPCYYGSVSNRYLKGNWLFSFMAANDNATFIPGFSVTYQYEYGD